MRFLGPGEVVGETAFMAETPHVTNAVAIDDSSVWRLARTDFDALLSQHEGLLRYLASLIGASQSRANARLAAESAPDETRALRGFVTAVYSPRGGAGVTTLAVNLALALAGGHPDDTVLFDLDVLFGHALANLWLEPRGVLAHVAPATIRQLDRGGLDYYLLPHSSSLRIFPAAARPRKARPSPAITSAPRSPCCGGTSAISCSTCRTASTRSPWPASSLRTGCSWWRPPSRSPFKTSWSASASSAKS